MCFGWLRCKFHKVMILHYDKVFYRTIKPALQHWSMVELKCFQRCSNCTTCGTTGLVSHWCCFWLLHRCRCVRCDTSNEVEQDSALLDHHGSSASEVFEVFGLPTLNCTMYQNAHTKRSKDLKHGAKTYENNWKHEVETCWKNGKPKGREKYERFCICIVMFGILIDCHWGKIHRALDNQDN